MTAFARDEYINLLDSCSPKEFDALGSIGASRIERLNDLHSAAVAYATAAPGERMARWAALLELFIKYAPQLMELFKLFRGQSFEDVEGLGIRDTFSLIGKIRDILSALNLTMEEVREIADLVTKAASSGEKDDWLYFGEVLCRNLRSK